MLDRRLVIWSVAIAVLFPLGLIGYYAFGSDLGDGLEVTMEKGGVEEGGPVLRSPLNYGSDYASTLLMGLLGTLLTLGTVVLIFIVLSKKRNKDKGSSR